MNNDLQNDKDEGNGQVERDLISLFQEKIKKITPKIDRDELIFNLTDEAIVAETWIYKFGKIISAFEDRDELNFGMQILSSIIYSSVIHPNSAYKSDIITFFELMEHPVDPEKVYSMLEKLAKEKFGPLIHLSPSISVSRIGRLFYLSYRKTKADLLAQEKKGIFRDLYWALEDAKNFFFYNEMGIDLDVIFSLIYNLRKAIESLDKYTGDLFLKNEIKIHLDSLSELISRITNSDIWKEGKTSSAIHLKEFMEMGKLIALTFTKAYNLMGIDLQYQIEHYKTRVKGDIFNLLSEYVVKKWDHINWDSFLETYPNSGYPIKIPVSLNKRIVLNAIKQFVLPKFQDPLEVLPKKIREMQQVEDVGLIFQSTITPMQEIQEEVIKSLEVGCPEWDHEMIFKKNRVLTIKRINSLLYLNQQGGIVLGDFKEIDEPFEKVKLYTSHQISEIPENINIKLSEVLED